METEQPRVAEKLNPNRLQLFVYDEKKWVGVEDVVIDFQPFPLSWGILGLFSADPNPVTAQQIKNTTTDFERGRQRFSSRQNNDYLQGLKSIFEDSLGRHLPYFYIRRGATNAMKYLINADFTVLKEIADGQMQEDKSEAQRKGHLVDLSLGKNHKIIPDEEEISGSTITEPKSNANHPNKKSSAEIEAELEKNLPEIPSTIVRRKKLNESAEVNTKLRIIKTPIDGSRSRYGVEIRIPGRKIDLPLILTSEELSLLTTIINGANPYHRETLEMKLAVTQMSDIFDSIGGFENVVYSLNRKIKAWGLQVKKNPDDHVVMQKYSPDDDVRWEPVDRRDNNLERNEGSLHHRSPSHGNQRI